MRKSFIVRPKLQLTHLFWVLGTVTLSFCTGYFLLESTINAHIQNGPLTPENWGTVKSSLRIGFIVVLVLLLAVIGMENFLYFHRIVGPLHAFEKGLKRLARGDFNDTIQLRDSDELKDLAVYFEDLKKSLKTVRAKGKKKAA